MNLIKVQNIKELKTKSLLIFIITVLFSILLSVTVSIYSYNKYSISEHKLKESILISKFSEFLSQYEYKIISISSQPFFQSLLYANNHIINSKYKSQKNYEIYSIEREISLISSNSKNSIFSGSDIYNKNNYKIIKIGKKSQYFIYINLCYLSSNINEEYGICNGVWKLYINEDNLLKKIKLLNINISKTKTNGQKINKYLKFKILKETQYNIPEYYINIEKTSSNMLLYMILIIIIMSMFLVLFFILIQKLYLKNYIDNIDKINDMLSCENKIDIKKIYYLNDEILLVINSINNALRNKKNETISQLIHDLRRPFSNLQKIANNNLHGEVRSSVISISHQLSLSIYKLYSDEKQPFDLYKLIIEASHSNYIDYIQNNKIILEIEKGCFSFINNVLLMRVINNMIENSIRSTDKNRKPKIIIKLNRDNKLLTNTIEIIDNGVGINENEIKNIFNNGVSYTNSTGKGLFFCKTIIDDHKGSISVKSNTTQTNFKISLPITTAPKSFIHGIYYNKNSIFIIIDDEIPKYLYKIESISKYIHLKNTKEIELFFKEKYKNKNNNYIFLVDYHINDNLNGIDIINKFNIIGNSYLISTAASFISSQYYESIISEEIPILSKINEEDIKFILVDDYEIIYMDDDTDIIDNVIEKYKNIKKILPALNFLELSMIVKLIPKNTIIILDNRVYGSKKTGINIAISLYEDGFKKIAIQTGDDIKSDKIIKIEKGELYDF